MSEEKPAEKPADDHAAAPAGGGTSKVVMIMLGLVIVLLLAVVGGGVFLFMKMQAPAAAAGAAAAGEHGEGEHGEGEHGEGAHGRDEEEEEDDNGDLRIVEGRKLVELKPITANLIVPDDAEGVFLRITLSLEVEGEESAKMVEEHKSQIQAALLAYFRGLSVPDTRGPAKQLMIANEARVRVNRLFGHHAPVKRVWVGEFVVQS